MNLSTFKSRYIHCEITDFNVGHMLPLILAFLPLFGSLQAEEDLSQVVVPAPIPRPPVDALQERIRYLRQQNTALKNTVLRLELYRDVAQLQQQRLSDMEKKWTDAEQYNQLLQKALMLRNREIQQGVQLLKETQKKLWQEENRAKQAGAKAVTEQQALQKENQALQSSKSSLEREFQESEQHSEQKERAMQFLRDKSDQLQAELAKLRLENQTLQESLQKTAKERALQTYPTDELSRLNKQIRSLKSDIEDKDRAMAALQQQNETLNQAKTSAEQQLHTQSKRLGTYDETVKASQEQHAKDEALINEKTAAIEKWRQANKLLQGQLDQAASINQQLRQQIMQLQEQPVKSP